MVCCSFSPFCDLCVEELRILRKSVEDGKLIVESLRRERGKLELHVGELETECAALRQTVGAYVRVSQ